MVSGLVCLHCGQTTSHEPDIDQERTALKELHHWLGEADKKKAAKLLRAAFLPSHPDLLVDAGIQCLPFIRGEIYDLKGAAINRLEAIEAKLQILPQDATVKQALRDFRQAIDSYYADQKKSNREMAIFFIVVAIILIALCVGLCFWTQ
jgi:hypothetical protein